MDGESQRILDSCLLPPLSALVIEYLSPIRHIHNLLAVSPGETVPLAFCGDGHSVSGWLASTYESGAFHRCLIFQTPLRQTKVNVSTSLPSLPCSSLVWCQDTFYSARVGVKEAVIQSYTLSGELVASKSFAADACLLAACAPDVVVVLVGRSHDFQVLEWSGKAKPWRATELAAPKACQVSETCLVIQDGAHWTFYSREGCLLRRLALCPEARALHSSVSFVISCDEKELHLVLGLRKSRTTTTSTRARIRLLVIDADLGEKKAQWDMIASSECVQGLLRDTRNPRRICFGLRNGDLMVCEV